MSGRVDRSVVRPAFLTPGTKDWAETVVSNARSYALGAEQDIPPLVERYRALCEGKAWEVWFEDEPRTLDRFCREALGYPPEFIEALAAAIEVLDASRAVTDPATAP